MGLQNQVFLGATHWQAQFSFQYANTDDFYVGDQRNYAPFPNGKILYGVPPRRRVAIYALDAIYGVTNRLSLDLTVPFLSGSAKLMQGSPESHQYVTWQAGGLGDISFQAEYWLNDPTGPSRISGSVALGVKTPTGSDSVTGTYLATTAGASDVVAPIDEGAQLGNGGWALLLRAQGTAQIAGPVFAYGSGYYGLSLTEHTNVHQYNPGGSLGPLRGVPDTYSARLGVAYLLPVLEGLVFSAGGRINGVTVKDVIGGGDLYWRRPGYEIYVEPGITWTHGANLVTFSVPLRVYQNKLDSLLDVSKKRHVGSDFAPFLIIASAARRF